MLGGIGSEDQEVQVSGSHQGQGGDRGPEDVQGEARFFRENWLLWHFVTVSEFFVKCLVAFLIF